MYPKEARILFKIGELGKAKEMLEDPTKKVELFKQPDNPLTADRIEDAKKQFEVGRDACRKEYEEKFIKEGLPLVNNNYNKSKEDEETIGL